MADLVQAVAGWFERVRGAGQAGTRFEATGVQGLMGWERATGRRDVKSSKPHLWRSRELGDWVCSGLWALDFDDSPAAAWERWRKAVPWWRRWLVPHARGTNARMVGDALRCEGGREGMKGRGMRDGDDVDEDGGGREMVGVMGHTSGDLLLVVRDDDPRMRDTPTVLDGGRFLVRESDWPAMRAVLMRHQPASVIAAEATRQAAYRRNGGME